MLLYDFECPKCGWETEELVRPEDDGIICKCGCTMARMWKKTAVVLTTIIPDYPGSKRLKAGYTHTTKADQSATRIQSGYGGCVKPTD